MRVAAYLRVSTDEQADKGNSLNEQNERLVAYCRAMGWSQPVIYIDDGFSAKDLKRPRLKALLTDIERGQFDILLTTKLDRFTRNLLDLLQTIKLIEKHNCAYVSATESFDTSTAAGRMVLQLLGVFAEFERQRTSERVSDNMDSLAKNTDQALSGPCFGYDIVDKRYKINDEEAKYILRMVELAEAGHGTRKIAKELNDKGVLTKRGNMWDSINVRRLLKTETIAGMRVRNKRKKVDGKIVFRPKEEWHIKENNHQGIIDTERFWQLQSILESRSRSRRHAENETYLLTGVIKCGHCGKTMKGSTARVNRGEKRYTYYRYICSSYQSNYSCKYHFAHRDELEKEVIQMIKSISTTSTVELELKVASKTTKEEIKEVEQQLNRLNHQIQRQIEAHSKGLIEDEDLKLANERVKEERKLLKAKLEMLKEGGGVDSVKKNIEKNIGDITSVDRKKAKSGIIKIIESMELKDNNIEIVWRA